MALLPELASCARSFLWYIGTSVVAFRGMESDKGEAVCT